MPVDRPLSLHCFLERDSEYFAELQRLRQAVVLYTKGFQWDLHVDNVVQMACRTNLVKKEELQVSEMSGSRFLIVLPEGLDPETFINATPSDLWEEGFTFQPWSPLDDASISVPAYKVLLRLVGLPPHLCRERYVRSTVARFGVFLGSLELETSSSIASWLVAVGVDDLTLVPPQLVVHIGGMMYYVQTYAEAWHRAPIYTAEEMPKHPTVFTRPQPAPPSPPSSDDDILMDDMELIPTSSRVLRDICRGPTAESLSPELRQFATMEVIDMEDPCKTTQQSATQNLLQTNQGLLMATENHQDSSQLPLDQVWPQPGARESIEGHSMEAHRTTQLPGRIQSFTKESLSLPPREPPRVRCPPGEKEVERNEAGRVPKPHDLTTQKHRRI